MGDYRYTPEQVISALKEARGLRALAARRLGCTVRTVDNYIARFPEVSDTVKEQLELRLDVAEGKLDQAVNKGEAWAICFFLKTQGKGRKYSERLEVVGADGGSLKQEVRLTVDPRSISLEQAESARKAIEEAKKILGVAGQ